MNQHLNFPQLPQPFILPLFVHIKAYPCVLFKIHISLVLDVSSFWQLAATDSSTGNVKAWHGGQRRFSSCPMVLWTSLIVHPRFRICVQEWTVESSCGQIEFSKPMSSADTQRHQNPTSSISPPKKRGWSRRCFHWFWPDGSCIFWIFLKDVFIANKNKLYSLTSLHKPCNKATSFFRLSGHPKSHFGNLFAPRFFQESPAIPRESDEEVGSQKPSAANWQFRNSLGWRWYSWDLNFLDASAVFFNEFFSKSWQILVGSLDGFFGFL